MKRQSQSYREEICWSWKSVHVWWRIIKWVKDGTQMHEKHEPEEVSQQHVCKLRLRSRWKEWGKCWLANAGKQMGIFRSVLPAGYQVLDQICTVHQCVKLVFIFNSAYHTGGIAISSCCATGGTLHTWDGRISLDLKQIYRFHVVRARRHRADVMQIYGASLKPVPFHKIKTYLNNTNTACLVRRGLLNGCLLIEKWFLSEITVPSTVSTVYFLNQCLLTPIYLHISQFSLYREVYWNFRH